MRQQRFLDKADGARCGSSMVHVLRWLGLVALIATILVSFPGCDGGKKRTDGDTSGGNGNYTPPGKLIDSKTR